RAGARGGTGLSRLRAEESQCLPADVRPVAAGRGEASRAAPRRQARGRDGDAACEGFGRGRDRARRSQADRQRAVGGEAWRDRAAPGRAVAGRDESRGPLFRNHAADLSGFADTIRERESCAPQDRISIAISTIATGETSWL